MEYKTVIVGIAGGTGSGKTSVTRAIIEELKKSRARDKKSRNYFRIIWKN